MLYSMYQIETVVYITQSPEIPFQHSEHVAKCFFRRRVCEQATLSPKHLVQKLPASLTSQQLPLVHTVLRLSV